MGDELLNKIVNPSFLLRPRREGRRLVAVSHSVVLPDETEPLVDLRSQWKVGAVMRLPTEV